MAQDSGNEWRRVIAALAHPDMRRVVALLALEQNPSDYLSTLAPSRRRHIVDGLHKAGLITEDAGALTLRDAVFAQLLAHNAPTTPAGVERYVRDGRIEQYPSRAHERTALLRWAADRVLQPGESVDERTVTDRLAALTDDPAALRRYLVDGALIERRPDGSQYARAATQE